MRVVRQTGCRRISSQRDVRGGIGTLELILALPILLLATLASFEFGILALVEQAVATATIDAAREAGKGANADSITDVVNQYLAAHHLTISPTSPVRLICERQFGGQKHVVERGNPAIASGPAGPAMHDGDVRITLCVRATDGQTPVPDWLASLGFSLADRTIKASSVARLE
jgi:hypothetical protein